MLRFDADGEVVRDEAFKQWLREDPVYMGLMKVQRLAIERDIADTQEWIEVWGGLGHNVDRHRRHLERLREQKAQYDEKIGSAD